LRLHPYKDKGEEDDSFHITNYSEGFIIMHFSEYNYGARNGSPNRECPQQWYLSSDTDIPID